MPANSLRTPCSTAAASNPDLTAGLSVTSLVEATPASRDRYVDFLRAISILVVVAWHWVFSITQWNDDGSLGMPNPIAGIPGLWLATWFLQIMPVFFFVGGFANLAGLERIEREGGGYLTFATARLRRLLKPIGVYLGVWSVIEVVAHLVSPSYTGVTHWGMVVFVPLWFLGVYMGVVLLAPITVRLHRGAQHLTIVSMGAVIVLGDVARICFGYEVLGLIGSAFVWIFAHQLGYYWRDGSLSGAGSRPKLWAMVVGGLTALIVWTNLGVYGRSMVSVEGETTSNMFPTTACIAALAVFQMGIVLLVRGVAERWLARKGPWTFTVSVNAIAMTVFTWHMTALVAAIGIYQFAGGHLYTEASAAWWAQRPLWIVLPGVLLAALIALFARFELPKTRTK
jgi:surface polysaccharide O-acyltransferase-like enzyme